MANTWELRFERQAAYSSDCSVELPLRPSARVAAPLGPRLLFRRLRAEESVAGGEECQWALTQTGTLWGGGAPQGGDLRPQGGEDSGERGGALDVNSVQPETANEGQSRSVTGEQACQRVLTERRARERGHSSEVTALPLSASNSLVIPSAV